MVLFHYPSTPDEYKLTYYRTTGFALIIAAAWWQYREDDWLPFTVAVILAAPVLWDLLVVPVLSAVLKRPQDEEEMTPEERMAQQMEKTFNNQFDREKRQMQTQIASLMQHTANLEHTIQSQHAEMVQIRELLKPTDEEE